VTGERKSPGRYQAENRRLSERLGDELIELAATVVSNHVESSRVARAEVDDE
jgi:predicted transcriptional regulator